MKSNSSPPRSLEIYYILNGSELKIYSQLYDKNDILLILINLMKIDDIIMLHLRQYVNLLLNISHCHPTSGAFNPLLLYILCSVLSPKITILSLAWADQIDMIILPC